MTQPSPEDTAPVDPYAPRRAMIALYPEPSVAQALALVPTMADATAGVEVESAEDLHVTIAYYPLVTPEDRDVLLQRAARVTEYTDAPMSSVEGIGFFFSSDGVNPHVLILDPRMLHGLYERLCMAAGPASPIAATNHGFTPHITLAYAPDGVDVSIPHIPTMTLVFSRVSVVYDDGERHDFAFNGPGVAYRSFKKAADSPPVIDEQKVSTLTPPEEPSAPTPVREPVEKVGRRLQGSWLKRLGDTASELKRILSWADYEEEEETEDAKVKAILSTIDASGAAFMVFKDNTGADRWLSFSSNGFEDREREIVSTDALERAVTLADAGTYERGPLRLFHIDAPLADIGDCDFQAMEGRFLIESGTFRDSEVAQRALSYFESTEDLLGVSIGFAYPKAGGFTEGIYREIQIIERSVCPHESVANPYTLFQALSREEDSMNRVKASWLERVLGGDTAQAIITQAQDTTKALEGSVAFKQLKTADPDPEMEKALVALQAEVSKGDAALKGAFGALVKAMAEPDEQANQPDPPAPTPEPEPEPVEAVKAPDQSDAFVTAITAKVGEMLSPINDTLVQYGKDMAALGDRLKSVEEVEQQRKDNLPAGAAMFRATASGTNVIDEADAKKELAIPSPGNAPVQAYVEMLKGMVS